MRDGAWLDGDDGRYLACEEEQGSVEAEKGDGSRIKSRSLDVDGANEDCDGSGGGIGGSCVGGGVLWVWAVLVGRGGGGILALRIMVLAWTKFDYCFVMMLIDTKKETEWCSSLSTAFESL